MTRRRHVQKGRIRGHNSHHGGGRTGARVGSSPCPPRSIARPRSGTTASRHGVVGSLVGGARVAWKREGGEHTFSSPDKRALTKTDRGRQETSAHVGTNTAPFKGQPGGSVRGQQLLQAPQGVGGRGGCAARGLPTKRPPEEGREQCVCGWRGHRPRFQTQRLCQSHTAS